MKSNSIVISNNNDNTNIKTQSSKLSHHISFLNGSVAGPANVKRSSRSSSVIGRPFNFKSAHAKESATFYPQRPRSSASLISMTQSEILQMKVQHFILNHYMLLFSLLSTFFVSSFPCCVEVKYICKRKS